MNDQVFVSIAVSLVLGLVAFYGHEITEQLPRIFQDAGLPSPSKDDNVAKTEKKEVPTPPAEPPTINGEGIYHRFRGYGKAKQQFHV
jgi:hypothetical protein